MSDLVLTHVVHVLKDGSGVIVGNVSLKPHNPSFAVSLKETLLTL